MYQPTSQPAFLQQAVVVTNRWQLLDGAKELDLKVHGCGCGCGCAGCACGCGCSCGGCGCGCSCGCTSDSGSDDSGSNSEPGSHGINVKDDVELSGLTDDITATYSHISDSWDAHAPNVTPTITSGLEGKHGTNSLHYSGNAIDLRTRNLTEDQIDDIASDLQSRLGNDYDVVIEPDHMHVEFDPDS